MMMSGVISNETGSCPICGSAVPLRHSTAHGRVADRYGCETCGSTTYATTRTAEELRREFVGAVVAVGLAG